MNSLKIILCILLCCVFVNSDLDLEDLTDEEKALLEEEFKNVFKSGIDSVSNSSAETTNEESTDDGPNIEMGDMESMQAAMSSMLDQIFIQAMQSKALKEILRKRISQGNITQILEGVRGSIQESDDEQEEGETGYEEGGNSNEMKDEL